MFESPYTPIASTTSDITGNSTISSSAPYSAKNAERDCVLNFNIFTSCKEMSVKF